MTTMWGADIAALAALGQRFQLKADELQNTVQQLSLQSAHAGWEGSDAQQFHQVWQGEHCPRLMAIASDLRMTGDRLIQQARDQEGASNAGAGTGSAGGAARWPHGRPFGAGDGPRWPDGRPFGPIDPRGTVNDLLAHGGSILSMLGDADVLDNPLLGDLGQGIQIFGYLTDGGSALDDLANGRYVDGGLNSLLLGGDISADALKASHHPHGYGIGVAVQAWTQAGRAAMDVDWSSQGLQQIATASRDDWAAGFGYAAQQMPLQLVKIFGF